jgi:hypothetical protein
LQTQNADSFRNSNGELRKDLSEILDRTAAARSVYTSGGLGYLVRNRASGVVEALHESDYDDALGLAIDLQVLQHRRRSHDGIAEALTLLGIVLEVGGNELAAFTSYRQAQWYAGRRRIGTLLFADTYYLHGLLGVKLEAPPQLFWSQDGVQEIQWARNVYSGIGESASVAWCDEALLVAE